MLYTYRIQDYVYCYGIFFFKNVTKKVPKFFFYIMLPPHTCKASRFIGEYFLPLTYAFYCIQNALVALYDNLFSDWFIPCTAATDYTKISYQDASVAGQLKMALSPFCSFYYFVKSGILTAKMNQRNERKRRKYYFVVFLILAQKPRLLLYEYTYSFRSAYPMFIREKG